MLRPSPRRIAGTLLVAAAVVLGAGPSPAVAYDWRGFKFLGTTCHNTSAGLIQARVRVRMFVYNKGYFSTYATNMRVRARLVHPGAGLDYTQSWSTVRFPYKNASPNELTSDAFHTADFTVNTEPMSPTQDWRLQIKLIWDRKAPLADSVEKFETTFYKTGCTGQVGPIAMAPPTGVG